jgi:hypothetical protein
MLVTHTLERLRQEVCEVKASLGFVARLFVKHKTKLRERWIYLVWCIYLFQALTQTLEMRENFQKQLQEIMSATSIVKPQAQRPSLSRSGCNSASSTPDSTRSARSGRSRVLEALRCVLVTDGGNIR